MTTTSGGFYRFDALSLSLEKEYSLVALRIEWNAGEISIDEYTSKSEFIIAKHRSGPTATINLIFKRDTGTFVNFIDQEEK